jgi:hypothetical protein
MSELMLSSSAFIRVHLRLLFSPAAGGGAKRGMTVFASSGAGGGAKQ